jgi:hypothetical protein
MKRFRLLSSALPVLALVSGPVAQANPVPTRLAIAHFGQFDGFAPGLSVDCDIRGLYRSEICVTGGAPGDPGCIVVTGNLAVMNWCWGPVIAPDAMHVPGMFDAAGRFGFGVDLALPDLIGNTFYFQAACLRTDPTLGVELSRGLEMTFAPGNAQPADKLTYKGPALTAIPCRAGDPYDPPTHDLLLRFAVPTFGYRAHWLFNQYHDGVTRVYVELSPPPYFPDLPLHPNTVRAVAELGQVVAPKVEVWVQWPTFLNKGDTVKPTYYLGAVVDMVY